MSKLNRRDFLGQAAATVGAAALAAQAEADAAPRLPRTATSTVTLGKTGLKTSFLGVGTGTVGGRHQSNQTRLGQEAFTRLIRHAYDRGITFFDCADSYGSHTFLREAIKGLPREKLFIQTKVINRDPQKAREDVDRFRKELGVDHIDSLLIHVVTRPTWVSDFEAVRDVLSEAQQRKVVRRLGVSCHSIGSLRSAAKSPWVEVDLARFNHRGEKMDDKPEVVAEELRAMRKQGKAVLGMKILGEGAFKTDEEINASLKYVLSSGCVDAIEVGFESPAQIDDLIKRIDSVLKELRA